MQDNKRELRQEKRYIKQVGNQQLRRREKRALKRVINNESDDIDEVDMDDNVRSRYLNGIDKRS